MMSMTASIRSAGDQGEWTPKPIQPSWILEGAPVARIQFLSESADGTASTWFWDCTAGRFNWFYSFDETLLILEGGFGLKDLASGAARRVVAGDIIYFPQGARAEWTVDRYVRKLAFCRTALPTYLVAARNVARRVKSAMRGQAGRTAAGGGMFSSG
jgi:uncharacterized cupin superfamily protein